MPFADSASTLSNAYGGNNIPVPFTAFSENSTNIVQNTHSTCGGGRRRRTKRRKSGGGESFKEQIQNKRMKMLLEIAIKNNCIGENGIDKNNRITECIIINKQIKLLEDAIITGGKKSRRRSKGGKNGDSTYDEDKKSHEEEEETSSSRHFAPTSIVHRHRLALGVQWHYVQDTFRFHAIHGFHAPLFIFALCFPQASFGRFPASRPEMLVPFAHVLVR